MKYMAMFLMLLSLSACISNNSASVNAIMGTPEMLINGEFNQQSLIKVATEKRKPTVKIVDENDQYSSPTVISSDGEVCSSGQDC